MANPLRVLFALALLLAGIGNGGCGNSTTGLPLPPDAAHPRDGIGADDGLAADVDDMKSAPVDAGAGAAESGGAGSSADAGDSPTGGDAGLRDAGDSAGSSGEAGSTPSGPAACDSTEAARATVLFRVPRATDPPGDTDFYRLPFPNDIRKRNGRVSLRGHPRPVDLVDRYLRAIEADATGFGTNQATYFRFSRDPDLGTLKQQGSVALVDISVGSPEYGRPKSLSWYATTGRTAYICNRFIAIRPPFGQPLRPGTTYAVILRKGVRDTSGNTFDREDDFAAMLAEKAPADADLASAWTAYAPLRGYLGDSTVSFKLTASELLAAAVFTTEDVEKPLAAIHAAIAAAPSPAPSGFVRCGDPGAVSPCDDGKTGDGHVRGCFPEQLAGASFDEYQGTISLPVFQQGSPPYAQPQDGGGILLDADGKVAIVRNEPVCVSLAVPKGTPPAAGWPVVVYSHGTGGSYRSAIALDLAEKHAVGNASGGAAVPMATLGYDGVLHGPRNGGSTGSTELLVYNFNNPRAARDNNLQAAADLLALPRAIASFGAVGIKLDAGHVALYGHSQGGNAAALAAARDAGYGAVIMSGTGGTLMLSLLGKTKPVNLPLFLPALLGDLSADTNHPMLNLIQMYCERSDPVNFARRLLREPLEGATRRHVLHVYGTADTFAPVETQRRYAQAAGLQVVLPLVDSYPTSAEYNMVTVTSPVVANQAFGSLGSITAAEAQYAPDGYDGHFVSTQNPQARQTIQKMLVTLVRDVNPIIEM